MSDKKTFFSLSKEDINTLRSIPLQDVMEKNGFYPVHRKDNEYIYNCPMPDHEDKDASFHVELYPNGPVQEDGESFARYNCISRGDIRGMGAISLQADLLGVSASENLMVVVKRLCADHGIRINGVSPNLVKWSTVDPVDEFQWVETAWNDDLLRALGCSVTPRFEDNYHGVRENTGERVYSWSYVGDINHESQRPMPFDPNDIGRVFGVYPIRQFTMPFKEKDGSRYSLCATADTPSTPIFIIKSVDKNGAWRVKKYEPHFADSNSENYKWTWWYQGGKNRDRDFASALYGDCDVIDALYNTETVPQDTSVYRNHPTVSSMVVNEKGEEVEQTKFKRVCICSGPRDAMQVYYHSNCHVVYPHSESAVIDKRLILRLFKIAAEIYILYDADYTGRSKACELNMEYLQMRNIELPSDLSMLTARRNGKPCKDVSDFFERYYELMRKQPKNAKKTLNERFEALICDARPLKFWIKMYNKSLDAKTGGEVKYKYTFVTDNIKRFCECNGFVTVNDGSILRFAQVTNNVVRFIPDDKIVSEVQTCMKEWLSLHPYHNDPALNTHIDMSHQYITIPLLQRMRTIEVAKPPVGPSTDFFFFQNGALRITPYATELIPYEKVPFFVNADKVKPYGYLPFQDSFSIVQNVGLIERYEQERDEEVDAIDPSDSRAIYACMKRWRDRIEAIEYSIEWHVPINEQPEVVQYLWDVSRQYWKEEERGKLTAEQYNNHVRNFVNKVAGIGFLLASHWSKSMSMILYLLDGKPDNDLKSIGRTGKSILASLVETVRDVVKIAGKGFKTSVEEAAKNFCEYDYRMHDVINVNDLNKSARAEMFNNWAEGEVTIKRNYKDSFTVPQGFEPKMMISSNKMFDMSEDSTRDRYWRMYFYDYYHTDGREYISKHSPYIKFGHNIPDFTSEVEFQATIHLMVQCLQFYMREQRYIKPPTSAAERNREANANKSIEAGFAQWATDLFASDRFFGIPISKRDLIIDYLRHKGVNPTAANINSYNQSTRFTDMLVEYCRSNDIEPNPDVCFLRASDRTPNKFSCPKVNVWEYTLDAYGNATDHRAFNNDKKNKPRCIYFYRYDSIPKSQTAVLHEQSPSNDPASDGYTQI